MGRCPGRVLAEAGGRGGDAVTCRLVVDLGADGRVSVSSWSDRDLRGGGAGEPSELAWHLDDGALDDLRWYLEDYLRAPFGVYGERGPQVEARLAGWGWWCVGGVCFWGVVGVFSGGALWGLWGERGPQVEARLAGWGEAAFAA